MLPGIPSPKAHFIVIKAPSGQPSKRTWRDDGRERINYCNDLDMIKSSGLEGEEGEPNRNILMDRWLSFLTPLNSPSSPLTPPSRA